MAHDMHRPPGRWATPVIGLVLLILALVPRGVALGSFSWPDELTWLERSSAFMIALEHGDLAGTYLADHPGVVPMWGFGTALAVRALVTGDRAPLDALAAVARQSDTPPEAYPADIPALLATAALFTVILTALAVVAAYALCLPLLGRTGAAMAGLLLALDPFFLTQSRVVHVDAILTSFMLLSALSLLVYLRQRERRRYLLLSGLMAGLAMLTKTPSLFLVPFAALVLGTWWLGRRTLRDLAAAAGALGLWLAIMVATFVLLWPAAWQRPLFFLWRLYRASRWGTLVSHGSNFFLGQPVDDPGPLFYGVVLPFRLSPLVMVLLVVAVVLLAAALWRRRRLPVGSDVALAGLAFILFFTIMVSLAAKKGDRYLLPVYPLADVAAAWALLSLLRLPLPARERRLPSEGVRVIAAVALILLTSVLWLRLAPYYGAYFNPLVGGGPVAARTFSFGQGEGLDLAARYLNDQENSQDLLAVTFYPQQFRYYFQGNVTSLRRGDWDKTWLFADYVVFYVSQVQRDLPTAGLVDFFSAQRPEYTARLGGVDFARVYRSPVLLSGRPPAVERRLGEGDLGAGLGEAFKLSGYAFGAAPARPGQDLDVTLYWQATQPPGADFDLELEMVNGEGQMVWSQAGAPFEGHFPTSWWRLGHTMLDRYRIALPADLAPGDYWLLVRARQPGAAQPLVPHGALDARWPESLAIGPIVLER